MTIPQLIGAALIALPFVALLIFCVRMTGWSGAGIVFGVSAALVVVVLAGTYLLIGPLS